MAFEMFLKESLGLETKVCELLFEETMNQSVPNVITANKQVMTSLRDFEALDALDDVSLRIDAGNDVSLRIDAGNDAGNVVSFEG